jgi:hypothetical protein
MLLATMTQKIHLISHSLLAFSAKAVAKECFNPPIHEDRVYDAIRSGHLPTHRVGVKSYILREDVIAWISRGLPIRRQPYRKPKVLTDAEQPAA